MPNNRFENVVIENDYVYEVQCAREHEVLLIPLLESGLSNTHNPLMCVTNHCILILIYLDFNINVKQYCAKTLVYPKTEFMANTCFNSLF